MNKDLTIGKVTKLIDLAELVLDWTGLSEDDLRWLFYYLCVKDENGKWRGLSYGNHYNVVFEEERIYIEIIDVPLFFDTKKPGIISEGDKPTLFKKRYCIKNGINDSDLGSYVIIPRYTGYERELNEE